MSINHQQVYNKTISITKSLMQSISVNEAWGASDFNEWEPIITALVVQHFIKCGFPIDEEWLSNGQTNSIRKCLDYLRKNVRSDGAFGADFWDSCRFASVIVENNLEKYFPFDEIKKYILEYARSSKMKMITVDETHASDWSGPGTYAACIHFLFCIDENDLAEKLLSEVLDNMQSDGSFIGKRSRTGDSIIHPVWHTAQVLRVILESKHSADKELISKIASWIESVMGNDGGFGAMPQYSIYYTSYAAMAFKSMPEPLFHALDKTYNYLILHEHDGEVESDGGSVMALEAFDLYLGLSETHFIHQNLELEKISELRSENNALRDQIEKLQQKVKDYEEKYKDADVILSKKEAWKFGIIISILILVFGIVAPVVINVLSSLFSGWIKHSSTEAAVESIASLIIYFHGLGL